MAKSLSKKSNIRPSVLVFGASKYEKSPSLSSPCLRASYEIFKAYVSAKRGFSLSWQRDVLDLFDDLRSQEEQLSVIEEWLAAPSHARDKTSLLICYIGHGDIASNGEY